MRFANPDVAWAVRLGEDGDDHTIHVPESSGHATIVIKREDGAHGEVSCLVTTKDGTAVAPHDYEAIPGRALTFADGETRVGKLDEHGAPIGRHVFTSSAGRSRTWSESSGEESEAEASELSGEDSEAEPSESSGEDSEGGKDAHEA